MSQGPTSSLSSNVEREALAGLVERVTFHNEESGFCVLRVKVRGQRDLMTVVGHAATISAGEFIQASGSWFNDRAHGIQFKAAWLRSTPPTTIEGIEKYLGSGMIKGIGPIYARKLVRAFGEGVFDVIEEAPDRLREVTGIGPKRAERIIRGWSDQKVIREIMLFLHAHGVGTSRAVRIFKTYGAEAIRVISENPYRLARDIRGIGFKTADAIAQKLGIEKTAMIRARAGVAYALAEAMDQGHCGLPLDELVPLAEKLLEIPADLIETALRLELDGGDVVADTVEDRTCIFLAGLYRAEKTISERLTALRGGRLPWLSIDAERAIPWVEKKVGITLAESQREALRFALISKVLVITGGPGVGKTTLVNSILMVLAAKGLEIALAAPTGRAAKRLSESTGREAKTISSVARSRSGQWGLPSLARRATRMQSPRRRRDLDGGRAADAGASLRRARHLGPAPGGRCRSAPLGRSGSGAGRHHLFRRGAGCAADRRVPASGAEPDHRQQSPDQSRAHAGDSARPAK